MADDDKRYPSLTEKACVHTSKFVNSSLYKQPAKLLFISPSFQKTLKIISPNKKEKNFAKNPLDKKISICYNIPSKRE